MYRAGFVQGVSALDTYVHAEVRVRMLDAYATGAPTTAAFDKFKVPMAAVRTAVSSDSSLATRLNWLDSELREQHSLLSFQHPDKIADAFRLVSSASLWVDVAADMGQGPVGGEQGHIVIKTRLRLIVERRNKIVHESDLDPTPPGTRLYPMSRRTADETIDFVEMVVHSIANVS